MRLLIVPLFLGTSALLGLAGCDSAPAPASDKAAVTATARVTGEHVHTVACACTEGKACANTVKIDDAFVPLTGKIGELGEMAFCGAEGELRAKVPGQLVDGKYVASSFELVQGELPPKMP